MSEVLSTTCPRCKRGPEYCHCELKDIVAALSVREEPDLCIVCGEGVCFRKGLCKACLKSYGMEPKVKRRYEETLGDEVPSCIGEVLSEEEEELGFTEVEDPADFGENDEYFDDELEEDLEEVKSGAELDEWEDDDEWDDE